MRVNLRISGDVRKRVPAVDELLSMVEGFPGTPKLAVMVELGTMTVDSDRDLTPEEVERVRATAEKAVREHMPEYGIKVEVA